MTISMGLDVGSNSVGSAWIDHKTGKITVGLSIFPAGVDESDEKRGDPKNAKRRATRRSRITLARRAQRKRLLRLKLISVSLLPADAAEFKELLQDTDPWELRRKALAVALKDISPQAPLHVLIVPRKHIASLNDLAPDDDALVGSMFRRAAALAKANGYEERGYRTVFNTNREAGQTVFHIHLHLLAGRSLTWPPG